MQEFRHIIYKITEKAKIFDNHRAIGYDEYKKSQGGAIPALL